MKLYFSPSRALAARRVREGGPRIYDPRERLLLGAFDRLLTFAAPRTRLAPPPPEKRGEPRRARRVLALRLDRLGDLVMTLPALAELRRILPEAEITLAVGRWNEELARGLPFVDRLLIVDLPSSAWHGRASWREAARRLREAGPPDLAIDFQGDVRALLLMATTGAPLRAGYADTGGGALLTHRGTWNEVQSWYRQNVTLLAEVFQLRLAGTEPYNFLLAGDRRRAVELMAQAGLTAAARPLIGIHPSAGRAIKQWEVSKFSALAEKLAAESGGTVVLTGSEADRALVDAVSAKLTLPPRKLLGGTGVRPFAAALERFDLFITGDTGPMHLAHAVGTRTLALFGPSDPVRYGPDNPDPRRVVLRQPLYCSPCNMIRRPPRECARREAPECLTAIGVERVAQAALELVGVRQ